MGGRILVQGELAYHSEEQVKTNKTHQCEVWRIGNDLA